MKHAKKDLPIFILLFYSFTLSTQAQEDVLVNELNPHLFNQQFTEYDQSTALFCAQVSEVAYWNERNISRLVVELNAKYLDENFRYKLIDDSYGIHHNQALLFGTKNFLIIAFRGTEPSILKDWMADAKYWNYENSEGWHEKLSNMPPGHGGFRRSLMRLMLEKNLISEIKKIIPLCNPIVEINAFPIFLTGHSLGAAISQLFIEPLKFNDLNFKGAYHFAPPLAVSCEFNSDMKLKYGNIVYDIINYKDYVPRAGRNNVAHFGKFYRICDDRLIYKETEAYVKFDLNEYFSEFKLHSLATHINMLRNKQNNATEINRRSIGHFPCMELKGKPAKLCD